MGYCNSPSHVQRFMDRTLKPFQHFYRAFIDDVVIFSDLFEEHLEHLRQIFALFERRGFRCRRKSYIGFKSVELLGFHVDAFGLSTMKERMQAFRDLEFPLNLKALETYLGAAGFL